MKLIADDVCRNYYGNMLSDNMFCAGRPDWSQDACEVFTTSPNSIRLPQNHVLISSNAAALSPTGRLGGTSGVRGWQHTLPVWSHQLGRRLRTGESTRRLHHSDQLQPMDRREDGADLHHCWLHVSSEMNIGTIINCYYCCCFLIFLVVFKDSCSICFP